MSETYYYICDGCGNIANITEGEPLPEDEEWACDECGSSALWEFTSKRNAMIQSNRIRAIHNSGLFRRV